jgi:aminopeptidase 2
MCKLHRDSGEAGGSLDIAKGREVLPKNVKPTHYDLTLEPNFETFKFDGKVVVE